MPLVVSVRILRSVVEGEVREILDGFIDHCPLSFASNIHPYSSEA